LPSTSTVLSISRDSHLQLSRTLLLNQAGHSVIELQKDSSVLRLIEGDSHIDLILICHSVETPSRVRLCTALRERYPAAPIVMFYTVHEFVPPEVTLPLECLTSPHKLLKTVAELLRTAPNDSEGTTQVALSIEPE
jgi:DNA-binding NtrC family response regulator